MWLVSSLSDTLIASVTYLLRLPTANSNTDHAPSSYSCFLGKRAPELGNNRLFWVTTSARKWRQPYCRGVGVFGGLRLWHAKRSLFRSLSLPAGRHTTAGLGALSTWYVVNFEAADVLQRATFTIHALIFVINVRLVISSGYSVRDAARKRAVRDFEGRTSSVYDLRHIYSRLILIPVFLSSFFIGFDEFRGRLQMTPLPCLFCPLFVISL